LLFGREITTVPAGNEGIVMSDEALSETETGWPGQMVYAPIETSARLGPAWATILVQILFVALAVFGSLLPILAMVIAWAVGEAAAGNQQPDVQAFLASSSMGQIVALSLLAQFTVWGAMALIWTRFREKRSFATIGLGGRGWSLRYGRGFILGIGLAVLLVTVAGLLLQMSGGIPEDGPDMSQLDWSRLMEPGVVLPLLMITALFMFQATAEEVAFRGWMMSSLAARTSILIAILVNSVVFGLMHVHVLMSGLGFGLVALSGLAATGVFLSVVAWKEGSIAGASGLHSGFNVSIIGSGLAVALIAEPDVEWGAVFADVLNASAGILEGEARPVTLELFAQLIVMLALAVLATILLRRKLR
jgi:membrane protease YdiL (CAAX protease family)